MADSLRYIFQLEYGEFPPPKEWMDMDIHAEFENNFQAFADIEELTFLPAHFDAIDHWTENIGYFEGMPFTITIYDDNDLQIVFDGMLDFSKYRVISPVERKIGIKVLNTFNNFYERAEAVTLGYLTQVTDQNNNFYITNDMYKDVKVVIKKRFDTAEVALASLSIAFVTAQIIQFGKLKGDSLRDKIRNLLEPPAGKPAGIFYTIAGTILLLAYTASMLIAIINVVKALIKNLAGRHTTYKGITLRKGLERICAYLGYNLDCDIAEIDTYTILPSSYDDKARKIKRQAGIPAAKDFGYRASEFFELVRLLFYAKTRIINNTVYIRAQKSDYWFSQSSYEMPDSLDTESYSLNTDEMKANYIISFQYDSLDEYTLPDENDPENKQLSTNYEMITELAVDQPDTRFKQNKGLADVRIPLALGRRRNKLSPLEVTLNGLASLADLLIKLFGGKPLGPQIEEGRGRVIISQANIGVAKLLPLDSNGYMPLYPADHLGARYLYENYHWWQSFVQNAENAQKKVYTDIKIPFDFKDLVKTLENPCFTTPSGKKGKFTDIKWRPAEGHAVASFWISEKYDNKLKSIPIES